MSAINITFIMHQSQETSTCGKKILKIRKMLKLLQILLEKT